MRNRFDKLIDDLEIRTLHGISALGPHLSFYTYSKDEQHISSVTQTRSMIVSLPYDGIQNCYQMTAFGDSLQ